MLHNTYVYTACLVIKLMNVEQIHVDISDTEFFTNWTKGGSWDLYKNIDLTGIA
jgi:pentose-5-phosphate-3-epimerase